MGAEGRELGCPSRPRERPPPGSRTLAGSRGGDSRLSRLFLLCLAFLTGGSFVCFKKSPGLWGQCRLHLDSQETLRAPSTACREGPGAHTGGR